MKITQNAQELFPNNKVKANNAYIVKDMMDNCLDTIFYVVRAKYPKVFKPKLYLSDCKECNAVARYADKSIIIYWGLIEEADKLIVQRYTEEVLQKYEVLKGKTKDQIHSGIRVYLERYVVLHELYHLWHGHALWKQKYKYDENGKIVKRISFHGLPIHTERATYSYKGSMPQLSKEDLQARLTEQALEHDADSCAVSMLIFLLMNDVDERKRAGILEETQVKEHISNEIALLMGALATAFRLFDGNVGTRFEKLNDLEVDDHPLPAIRMANAEEIADGCLEEFFPNFEERMELEDEWRKIVCDVEGEHDGVVDMGQIFYYPAYTEKAQRHLCKIKQRITEMQDTLEPFSVSNNAERLLAEDIEFEPYGVWFDENGRSLRDWVNPATGQPTAIRAKQKPIVKKKVPGRNDPCPCGSKNKFKRCCMGKGIYD